MNEIVLILRAALNMNIVSENCSQDYSKNFISKYMWFEVILGDSSKNKLQIIQYNE